MSFDAVSKMVEDFTEVVGYIKNVYPNGIFPKNEKVSVDNLTVYEKKELEKILCSEKDISDLVVKKIDEMIKVICKAEMREVINKTGTKNLNEKLKSVALIRDAIRILEEK